MTDASSNLPAKPAGRFGGLGVYCVFRRTPVILENAIEAPSVPGVKLHHMVTLRLNPNNGSGIAHVINGKGDPVIENKTARVDEH